jgi:Mg/Co/Ni transporter MgtE
MTDSDRQKRYVEENKKAGLVYFRAWVTIEQKNLIKEFMKENDMIDVPKNRTKSKKKRTIHDR